MTDTLHEPGWWQASDGNWYPPSQEPAQAVTGGGTLPPGQKTNGLAIASLILSLLWFGGLGSILAVVFGFVARSRIRRSQGRQSGGGLAVAGIVIGIVGLAGTVLLSLALFALGSAVIQAVSPQTVPLGHVVNVSSSASDGVATMTVSSVTIQAAGATGSAASGATGRVAVASVKACAGSHGSQSGVNLSSFALIGKGNVSVNAIGASDVSSLSNIGAGQCAVGTLTFPVPTGVMPTAVQYWPEPIQNYEWSIPRS